jgi:hypothetical protein
MGQLQATSLRQQLSPSHGALFHQLLVTLKAASSTGIRYNPGGRLTHLDVPYFQLRLPNQPVEPYGGHCCVQRC